MIIIFTLLGIAGITLCISLAFPSFYPWFFHWGLVGILVYYFYEGMKNDKKVLGVICLVAAIFWAIFGANSF